MPASADCSPMRSSRPSSLFACSSTASGMPASAIFVRYSSTIEAESSPSSRWIDSICLRRKYSRCCWSAPSRTSSRILRRSCSSTSRSRWIFTASSSRSVTSSVSSTCDLLLEVDVGRVADRVGERARLDDRAQELRHALVGAAQLEDLGDDRAVLALGGAGAPVDGDVVRMLGDLDPQLAGGVGVRGARDAAGDAGERHGAAAAGQPHAVGDLGDRADLGELAVVARDQQHAILVARVDGQRHVHGGEDDRVVEGDEQERGHVRVAFSAIAAYDWCVSVAAGRVAHNPARANILVRETEISEIRQLSAAPCEAPRRGG